MPTECSADLFRPVVGRRDRVRHGIRASRRDHSPGAALTLALSNPRARGKQPAAGPAVVLFGCFFFAAVAGGRWRRGRPAMGSRRRERARERARRKGKQGD